jgi:hypothetical protein
VHSYCHTTICSCAGVCGSAGMTLTAHQHEVTNLTECAQHLLYVIAIMRGMSSRGGWKPVLSSSALPTCRTTNASSTLAAGRMQNAGYKQVWRPGTGAPQHSHTRACTARICISTCPLPGVTADALSFGRRHGVAQHKSLGLRV